MMEFPEISFVATFLNATKINTMILTSKKHLLQFKHVQFIIPENKIPKFPILMVSKTES